MPYQVDCLSLDFWVQHLILVALSRVEKSPLLVMGSQVECLLFVDAVR